jgi:Arc/MetJ-type ribon-helix-helix transcriptional regulator
MEVTLTPEQTDFVRHAVEVGRIRNSDQAVQEAMALWVDRERRRVELVTSLDAAETSLARGEGRPITQDSMKTLARDVMERNRHRFAAEQTAGP